MGNTMLNSKSKCNECGCRKDSGEKCRALEGNENAVCPTCNHLWNIHYD